MTADDEQRPPGRRPARGPQNDPGARRFDQGDLWAEPQDEPPAPPSRSEHEDFVAGPGPQPGRPPPRPSSSPRRAAYQAPAPPPPAYEDEEEYYDDGDEYSMLRNPYVLAGLAVAGAIVLAIFVVILFGAGGDGGGDNGVVTQPLTPQPGDLPGIEAEVIANAAIREGPGLEYFELGLARTGQTLNVVGRNEDASWFQTLFPGSELKGWVPDSAIRLPEGAESQLEVVVFAPIPKPTVEPTATPVPPTPTEEVPEEAPDILVEVFGNNCPTNGSLTVTIRNVGAVPIDEREITLTVATPEGVVSEQAFRLTLEPGQIVPVATGQVVQPPRTLVSVVFADAPQDIDPSNNAVTCVVGGGGQAGTAVPPPVDTPDNDD